MWPTNPAGTPVFTVTLCHHLGVPELCTFFHLTLLGVFGISQSHPESVGCMSVSISEQSYVYVYFVYIKSKS